MRDLFADLIQSAKARAGYADARFVRSRVERLSTRNGRLDQLDSDESEGIGVRVRVGGALPQCDSCIRKHFPSGGSTRT